MIQASNHGAKLRRALPNAGALMLGVILLSVWDLLAFDASISQWFGNAQGFPLRDQWFWQRVMHAGRWRARSWL